MEYMEEEKRKTVGSKNVHNKFTTKLNYKRVISAK